MRKKFSAWPKPLRRITVVVASLVAAAILAGTGFVSYNTILAPRLAEVTAAKCHAAYDSAGARAACRAGRHAGAASAEKRYRAKQKRKALAAKCRATYSDGTAQLDCVNGDTAAAEADQKSADAAAAAAAKKAMEGRTAANPYPAGTHVPMQSTNRLDGTKVTYSEWITGFDADWRGYDEFEAPDAGMKYVAFIVHVQANDAGVDAGDVAYDASFTDQDGNVYSRDSVTYGASPQMPDVTLGIGQQASGITVFQVPVAVTGGVATFGDGTVFVALQ